MAETLNNIDRLADYAREVMREYLYLMSDEDDEEQDDQNRLWQGFRVSAKAAARQFRGSTPELFTDDFRQAQAAREEILRQWLTNPPEGFYALAELAILFDLVPADIDIFIMAAAPAIAPTVEQLYNYARNDIHKRWADVGFVCEILAMGSHRRFEQFLTRLAYDKPLRRHRLILLEERISDNDHLDLNLLHRRIRGADRVLDFIRNHGRAEAPAVDETLASVCVRLREDIRIEELPLPGFSREALIQLARTRTLPVMFHGPDAAGNQRAAIALAGPLKEGLLAADMTSMLNETAEDLEIRLSEIFREARLGGDLVYLYGYDLPGEITGPTEIVLRRMLKGEALVFAADHVPIWLAHMTAGWPAISVPLPGPDDRMNLWNEAFQHEARKPSENSLMAIARRYELSGEQIHQAAAEARRLAHLSRRRRMELSDLDRACRAHFAHQLGELAQLIPATTFAPEDLVLPKPEKEKFNEILLYANEHESIFSDWGFDEKFPYGRGLSVLFHGPPGTGKTLGAMIIAGTLGLDLFRVDLSQILSRYVGETEKNLARVFDEAERGRVMLLFDEADSLFTKRTDVQTSVDRYANLEVAYLLQRMENFEGLTVLTTNVEALIDDAFKRRLRFRIYFPMPEADLRGNLWRKLMPTTAPIGKDIPWDMLGKYFELSGGHIKQVVLRAAVYARRDNAEEISLDHMIEAAQAECRELGMLMSEKLPTPLRKAAALARGEEFVSDEEEQIRAFEAKEAKKTAKSDRPALPTRKRRLQPTKNTPPTSG